MPLMALEASGPIGLAEVTAPTATAISLDDAKDHMRVDHGEEDSYVEALIAAATEYAQTFTRRQFIDATYDLTLTAFPAGRYFVLPRPPLQSITSITYVDSAGDTQTLGAGDYVVQTQYTPGRVALAYNESWPTIRSQPEPITVRFVAGYGSAAPNVPDNIRHALRLLVAHWYESREPVVTGTIVTSVPTSVKSLLWSFRVLEAA